MKRRTIRALPALLLVAMAGCGNTRQVGDADATTDGPTDVLPETLTDPATDTALDVPDIEDSTPDPADEDIEEEPSPECGNGMVEAGEECDDGDFDDCNGCSASCEWERAFGHEGTTGGAVVDSSVAPCLPESFTIEFWLKLDERMENTACYLIRQPGTFHYLLGLWDGSTYMSVALCEPGGCASSAGEPPYTVSYGTWHHLAMTFGYEETEGSWNFNIYLDGTWVEGPWGYSEPGTRPCDSGWYIVSTGTGPDDSGPCYLTMDEVRISEGVLYAWSFTPPYRMGVHPETIAYWSFNEQTGGVVRDETGHGHDAAMEDGTLVMDECHSP